METAIILSSMKTKKNAAAQALGRLGGSRNTKAQNAARRQNAQKAGRPRRVCNHCSQPVVGGHLDRELDVTCGARGWRWERAGTKHPAPPNPDRLALNAIAAVLAAGPKTRAADSMTAIATIMAARKS